MNYILTEAKSRINLDSFKYILSGKTYSEIPCKAFRDKLAANPGALKKIFSSGKS
jgi:hypothetical protein